ncbi:MAG: hypothetical protein ABIF11_02310 [Nitrospirota bacterium]
MRKIILKGTTMKQKVNITKSQNVTNIQVGRDMYYTQAEKAKELLPKQKEELTKNFPPGSLSLPTNIAGQFKVVT